MTIPLSLLLTHFIGDFLLQSDWMGINKSKNTREGLAALSLHVAIYSACFLWLGWQFSALTFATHFATDAVTSRITSRLWFIDLKVATYPNAERVFEMGHDYEYFAHVHPGRRHWFFVVIGLDQLIHALTLAATLAWLS